LATKLHILRHAKVDTHRGDVPLASDAAVDIERAAQLIVPQIQSKETVSFLTTATKRTKDTAGRLRDLLAERLGSTVRLDEPREEWALRNPDLFLAGRRVEMVSTPEAMASQLPEGHVSPGQVDALPFFHGFFNAEDRIGFWLREADPPGEDVRAVARRVVQYCRSLPDAGTDGDRRIICVSHSPVMRAVITHYILETDPGEPEWVEAINVTIEPGKTSFAFRGTIKTITD
jgi:broad specificity phosphatase PhoE